MIFHNSVTSGVCVDYPFILKHKKAPITGQWSLLELFIICLRIHQPILEFPMVALAVVRGFRVDRIAIPTKYDTLRFPMVVFQVRDG